MKQKIKTHYSCPKYHEKDHIKTKIQAKTLTSKLQKLGCNIKRNNIDRYKKECRLNRVNPNNLMILTLQDNNQALNLINQTILK